jgi:uncharacterized protein YbjT (DUF2867 family)
MRPAGSPDVRVAVVGATGTIGAALVPALVDAGHEVTALSRRGGPARSGVTSLAVDATDAAQVETALGGATVVVHLVHSLGTSDFEARDRAAARAVAAAARANGAQQIVYLGGLSDPSGELSPHLRSRAETAAVLAEAGVPVTTLAAAMIVGAGSAAFETILALVDRLPVMVCPRWVSVETQPVALADVVAALLAVAGETRSLGATYEVGGPERMTYREMLERTARIRGKRPLLIEVPFLTPRLSSLWLHLVTPVNAAVSRPLVEGLRVPTIARESRIWELAGRAPLPFDDAVRTALLERPG